MKRGLHRLLFISLVLAASLVLAQTRPAQRPAPPAAETIRHVILVSVDGLKPEVYLRPDELGLQVPTLRRLLKDAAYSEGARGVIPAVTYPSHTSIVTGVHPGTHGIFTNRVDDPLNLPGDRLRWFTEDVRVPTLYQVAEDKGLRTAMVYWPASVGARVDAIVPEFWHTAEGSELDQKLLRAMSTPGLLEKVARRFPGFYQGFRPPRVEDEPLTDVAVHLIETLKPHLLLLHIFDVDHQQHNNGLYSKEAKRAIEIADTQIGRLIAAAQRAGTWASTALVIVSDHGHTATRWRLRPGVWMAQAGLVTLDDRNAIKGYKAWLSTMSGMAFVYLKDEKDEATKERLVDLFSPVAGKLGSGVLRMYSREQLTQSGGDPRAFLALEASDGFEFGWGYSGDVVTERPNRTHHGRHPEHPDMWCSLVIHGPSIAPGRIPNARLIDVAPTIAGWLRLKMDQAEGVVLPVPRRRPAAPVPSSH
jgi:predicted AlkP superfamily pyrophosphatase or phosphodiesterase